MDLNVLGGGLVIAVAAGLWILYLVPSWMRRRNFDATERNAVRMQQTIRALAETADVPEEVHVKASAQAVLAQKRALKKAELAARNEVRAATVAALGHNTPEFRAHHAALRARRVSAFFLLATIFAVIVGIIILVNGGSWETLAISLVAFALMLFIQEGVVSSTSRVLGDSRSAGWGAQAAYPRGDQFYDHTDYLPAVNEREWVPTPLPRPLHLSEGSIAQAVVASQQAAERLRYATAEAAYIDRLETNRISAEPATAPVPQASPSRFSQMGVTVEVDDTVSLDIDQALRRRRNVG